MADLLESLSEVGIGVLKFGTVATGTVVLFNIVKFIAETVIALT